MVNLNLNCGNLNRQSGRMQGTVVLSLASITFQKWGSRRLLGTTCTKAITASHQKVDKRYALLGIIVIPSDRVLLVYSAILF